FHVEVAGEERLGDLLLGGCRSERRCATLVRHEQNGDARGVRWRNLGAVPEPYPEGTVGSRQHRLRQRTGVHLSSSNRGLRRATLAFKPTWMASGGTARCAMNGRQQPSVCCSAHEIRSAPPGHILPRLRLRGARDTARPPANVRFRGAAARRKLVLESRLG